MIKKCKKFCEDKASPSSKTYRKVQKKGRLKVSNRSRTEQA